VTRQQRHTGQRAGSIDQPWQKRKRKRATRAGLKEKRKNGKGSRFGALSDDNEESGNEK
jgi:hypothetical protein